MTQTGDIGLLFRSLPYDFEEDLPLPLGPNVYLANTPQNILDKLPVPLACFVLPGYDPRDYPNGVLPLTLGINNCCLLKPFSEGTSLQPDASDLFFLAITALRLRRPIGIEIAGQFKIVQGPELISDPELFQLASLWQPEADVYYSAADIRVAAEITARLLELANSKCSRIMSALVMFSQVTCGHSKSLQMAYLGLFAALEALFVPQGNKANS